MPTENDAMSKEIEVMAHFSNIDTIYAEYPFMHNVAPRSRVTAVRVKRAETVSLEVRSPLYEEKCWRPIWLLDSKGNIVTRVGTNHEQPNETIGQALARIGGRSEDVKWFLSGREKK